MLTDPLSREFARMNRQQKHERHIVQFIPHAPCALYDIGVGWKSEWRTLREVWPEMKVFGCEPNPATHAHLAPAFPGPLHPLAITGSPGPQVLHTFPPGSHPNQLGSSSLFAVPDAAGPAVPVECMTLDEFDRRCRQPDGILLWMDVEGSEADALRSGAELLASGRVRWINLEVWPRPRIPGWASAAEIHDLLSQYGFVRRCKYADCGDHHDVIYLRP